jgi:hypothetical protein
MSALFNPACGRAAGWLSILTTSAGRWMISSAVLTGSPVSGNRITTGNVVVVVVDVEVDVVVLGTVVVVVDVVVVVVVLRGAVVVVVDSALPPDEQAASVATASATTDVR